MSTFGWFKQLLARRHVNKISVLIPAYEASNFILETLDSIADQSFSDLTIIISIDKSADKTSAIVKKWCAEHKKINTKLFVQKHRLGQVENINFLIRKCSSKYFTIVPHDDLLEKDYLLKLIKCLEADDQAILVFSDIQAFGLKSHVIIQESTIGNRLERTLQYIRNNAGAEPFRGLVNTQLLESPIYLFHNGCSDFAADTTWVIQLAMKGNIIRVPEFLYKKRFHKESLFSPWEVAEISAKSKAWLEHCKDCLKVVLEADFNEQELNKLINAIQLRLVNSLWYANELNYSEVEKSQLLKALEDTRLEFGNR